MKGFIRNVNIFCVRQQAQPIAPQARSPLSSIGFLLISIDVLMPPLDGTYLRTLTINSHDRF